MKNNKHISLEEIGKELPFGLPDNYFNQFAQQMEEQIMIKRVPLRKIFKPWMYMAAMFIGVLLMVQIFYSVSKANTSKNAENYESYVLSQVDETSIMDYYTENSTR